MLYLITVVICLIESDYFSTKMWLWGAYFMFEIHFISLWQQIYLTYTSIYMISYIYISISFWSWTYMACYIHILNVSLALCTFHDLCFCVSCFGIDTDLLSYCISMFITGRALDIEILSLTIISTILLIVSLSF